MGESPESVGVNAIQVNKQKVSSIIRCGQVSRGIVHGPTSNSTTIALQCAVRHRHRQPVRWRCGGERRSCPLWLGTRRWTRGTVTTEAVAHATEAVAHATECQAVSLRLLTNRVASIKASLKRFLPTRPHG